MEKEAKRAAKLEQKASLVTGGLASRHEKLRGEVEEAWEALRSAQIELACFQALHEAEQRAAPDRIEGLQELVGAQARRERDLQEKYKLLGRERDDLLRARQKQQQEAQQQEAQQQEASASGEAAAAAPPAAATAAAVPAVATQG